MTNFRSRDGATITITREHDGSYYVESSEGGSASYGSNSAEHIAKDWHLEGTGFSLDKVGDSKGSGDSGKEEQGTGDGDTDKGGTGEDEGGSGGESGG